MISNTQLKNPVTVVARFFPWAKLRKTDPSQERSVISASEKNSSDRHGTAGDDEEHEIVLHDKTAVAFLRQEHVTRRGTAERHYSQAFQFPGKTLGILHGGLGRHGVDV